MAKKTLVFTTFAAALLLDLASKRWALGLDQDLRFGPLVLLHRENHGIIMGYFAHLPSPMRTVFLGTVGVSLFALFQYIACFNPFRTLRFHAGLGLLFSGILGNTVDRIENGSVVDFISLKLGSLQLPFFNLADAAQLLGCALLAASWRTELRRLVPDHDRRQASPVFRAFRWRLTLRLLLVFIGISLVVFSFNYAFIRYSLESVPPGYDPKQHLSSYILMYGLLQVLILVLVALVARSVARKIYGPIQAIERYLSDTLANKSSKLKLRHGDDFKGLEKKLSQLNKEYISASTRKIEDKPKRRK